MARSQRPGRGLSSLIPTGMDEVFGRADAGPSLREIPINSITPNPHQPRRHFDEDGLNDLSASIRQLGVLQPILVRPVNDGFELIAGERRWRAATRAGLVLIPAVIRTTDDMSSMEQALVENLHRADLTPLEEAAAYNQLIDDFGLTHEQVAERVGKSRSAITNSLRLLGLPTSVQAYVDEGQLTARHARALLSVDNALQQEELAVVAVRDDLTVRQLEALIAPPQTPDVPERERELIDGAGLVEGTRLRDAGVLELERLLSEQLSTRVRVALGATKGRISIEFADRADLHRIFDALADVRRSEVDIPSTST